ncbi:hypothetical protein KR018_004296, partial [Drosophila ironensis]
IMLSTSRWLHRAQCLMAYYAVASGRKVGVYDNWEQCEQQVKGFKNAKYKKFNTRREAEEFVNGSKSNNYAPQEAAVPLGQKQPKPGSWTMRIRKFEKIEQPKYSEAWPEENHDEVEQALNAAMNEVEGEPRPSSSGISALSRKRGNVEDVRANKIPRLEPVTTEAVGMKHVGAFEFEIDADGYVIVYTDGSCIRNGQPGASAGYGVFFGRNHPLNAGKPVSGRVTNNVGEIQASIHAIKIAQDLGIAKLSINTDSQFLINSVTLWLQGWKRRGWMLKSNQPVKNVVDFKELDALLQNQKVQVKWNYVEAHKGIEGNEMADKLAREGSALYKAQNS